MCDQCIFQYTQASREICADCPIRVATDYQALRKRWLAQYIAGLLLMLGTLCLVLALVVYIWSPQWRP